MSVQIKAINPWISFWHMEGMDIKSWTWCAFHIDERTSLSMDVRSVQAYRWIKFLIQQFSVIRALKDIVEFTSKTESPIKTSIFSMRVYGFHAVINDSFVTAFFFNG